MLSLKRLTFNNIGRFITEQTIDFTQYDKLVQVNGVNKNTGGSSGAAKSTVFHALDYLLGINDIPATALQSRLTKETILVEGDFEVDTIPLTIKRSKKDGLTIKFGDETISGNVKLAEERLEEIIRVSRKLFKKMVHKKQKEGGFFLNLTAKECYDFLMKALGLEKTSEKTAKIDEDIKTINIRIIQLGHAIDAMTNSVDEIEQIMDFEKAPTCNVNLSDIEKIEFCLQTVSSQIKSLEAKKQEDTSKLEAMRPVKYVLSNEEDSRIGDLELKLNCLKSDKTKILMEHLDKKKKLTQAIDDIKSKLYQIGFARKAIDASVAEMKELIAQKTHIEESKCPTCLQQWAGDTAANKITSINNTLANLKQNILDSKTKVGSEPELRSQLERIEDILKKLDCEGGTNDIDMQISDISTKIVEIKANRSSEIQKLENEYLKKLNEHNEQIKGVRDTFEMYLKPKKEEFDFLNRDLQSKKTEFLYFKTSLESYNSKMEKYKKTLDEKKLNLQDAILQKEQKNKELAVAEETKRLIKTYTLQIFQDSLDYIGTNASEILSDIPNMTNVTVYFEGCKENQSGTIKDEVNPIVNMDGYEDINIKTLSGGEKTAIDLAVDLAVIDMVELKAGMGADFLILDEPFDGLEDINIAQCLEVLKQVDTNKKIIIVDHNPIAKEMITDTIVVERDGEQSVVL